MEPAISREQPSLRDCDPHANELAHKLKDKDDLKDHLSRYPQQAPKLIHTLFQHPNMMTALLLGSDDLLSLMQLQPSIASLLINQITETTDSYQLFVRNHLDLIDLCATSAYAAEKLIGVLIQHPCIRTRLIHQCDILMLIISSYPVQASALLVSIIENQHELMQLAPRIEDLLCLARLRPEQRNQLINPVLKHPPLFAHYIHSMVHLVSLAGLSSEYHLDCLGRLHTPNALWHLVQNPLDTQRMALEFPDHQAHLNQLKRGLVELRKNLYVLAQAARTQSGPVLFRPPYLTLLIFIALHTGHPTQHTDRQTSAHARDHMTNALNMGTWAPSPPPA